MILKYLWYVIRHKWYVFVECCKLGVPWLGIIHDLSKFSRAEFMAYARNFYGDYPTAEQAFIRCPSCGLRTKESVKREFDYAWLHHQKANKHHWQYWLLQYDKGERYNIQAWGDGYENMLAINGTPTLYVSMVDGADDDAGRAYSVSFKILKSVVDDANIIPVALPMPPRYMREMIADWIGAGKAINGKNADACKWYIEHRNNILLHERTRTLVENMLGV